MKSILLLGSGLMAESVIVYLLRNPRVSPPHNVEPHTRGQQNTKRIKETRLKVRTRSRQLQLAQC